MNIRKVECLAMWIGIVAFIMIVSSIMIGASQEQRATARRIKWFALPSVIVLGTCSLAPLAIRFWLTPRKNESENELREVGFAALNEFCRREGLALSNFDQPQIYVGTQHDIVVSYTTKSNIAPRHQLRLVVKNGYVSEAPNTI